MSWHWRHTRECGVVEEDLRQRSGLRGNNDFVLISLTGTRAKELVIERHVGTARRVGIEMEWVVFSVGTARARAMRAAVKLRSREDSRDRSTLTSQW